MAPIWKIVGNDNKSNLILGNAFSTGRYDIGVAVGQLLKMLFVKIFSDQRMGSYMGLQETFLSSSKIKNQKTLRAIFLSLYFKS